MRFVGDIHGRVDEYLEKIAGSNESLQLGDFGYGFVPIPDISLNHRFIRGNHDDPALCRNSPNYMGDWGMDMATGIYYISGAFSIDKYARTTGVDWWPDEELPYSTLAEVIEDFAAKKADIVATHECPSRILHIMHSHHDVPSRTAMALDACFQYHMPKVWLFGHHHKYLDIRKGKTRFICLDELQTFDI